MISRAVRSLCLYRLGVDTEWVKARLAERGRTIHDIATRAEKDRASISRIVNGRQPLPISLAGHFAEILGVSEFEVLRRAGIRAPAPRGVPVISWVMASAFAEMIEPPQLDSERRIGSEYPGGPLYGLEVRGDSMDRVAPEWAIIICNFGERLLQDKDLGIFRRDGEATFKRFRTDGEGAWLEPDSWSERHRPITIGDLEDVECLARVVGVRYAPHD